MALEKDPICGMMVDTAKAKFLSVAGARTVHLCSASCKQRFDAAPQRFAK